MSDMRDMRDSGGATDVPAVGGPSSAEAGSNADPAHGDHGSPRCGPSGGPSGGQRRGQNRTQDGNQDGNQAERLARAALSRCLEPGDAAGRLGLELFGAVRWWEVVSEQRCNSEEADRFAQEAALAGMRVQGGPAAALSLALGRWEARARETDPARDLANASRLRGGYVIPGDPGWPLALDDLGPAAPLGIWWRGSVPPQSSNAGFLGVVGTRDPTGYGVQATGALAAAAVERGGCVVSGGALGIDAAAHRAALAAAEDGRRGAPGAAEAPPPAGPATIAVLAGGIDRLYPASNARLLGEIAKHHLLVSEHPPGCAATRWRFLERNRLIAALSAGVAVMEGRWRSGALSTAHHAAGLGRWVGALPGPVNAPTSEGPHRLIREGAAELISRPEDVFESIGLGEALLPRVPAHARTALDDLDEAARRVWESLPKSRPVDLYRLLTVAGLGTGEALAALHRLSVAGLAEPRGSQWARKAGAAR